MDVESVNKETAGDEPEQINGLPEDYAFPDPLARLRARQFFYAAVFLLASACGAVSMKDPYILLGSLVAAWFAWYAGTLESKYINGKIIEQTLICTSCRRAALHDAAEIGFSSCDEVPVYYRFQIAGKNKLRDFVPGNTYVVYYDKSNPSQLLAYLPL